MTSQVRNLRCRSIGPMHACIRRPIHAIIACVYMIIAYIVSLTRSYHVAYNDCGQRS